MPQKATIGLKFSRKGWHKKIIKHSNHPKAADCKVTIRKQPTGNHPKGNHPKAADMQVTKKTHEVIREIFYSNMAALP